MEQMLQFATSHWPLFLALVTILVLIFLNELFAQKKHAKEISPTVAIDKINHGDAIVIDLRDPESFRAGHIIDAILATTDDFNEKRMESYKTKPLILVCARGLQSSTLATKLRGQGFAEPLVLAGGIAAWQEAKLPLVKGKK